MGDGSRNEPSLLQPSESALDGALGELDFSCEFQNARPFQAANGRVHAQVAIGEDDVVGLRFHAAQKAERLLKCFGWAVAALAKVVQRIGPTLPASSSLCAAFRRVDEPLPELELLLPARAGLHDPFDLNRENAVECKLARNPCDRFLVCHRLRAHVFVVFAHLFPPIPSAPSQTQC